MDDILLTKSPIEVEKLFENIEGERKMILIDGAPGSGKSTLTVQWNPSKADTIGTKTFVRCSEVSLAQGLVVDHAPPTIAASYDKALLWKTKKTVLMRDLSTESF